MPVLPYGDHHPTIADDTFIAPNAYVIGQVTIGAKCGVWFAATIRADTGSIVLGEGVNVQDGGVIHTQDGSVTSLGNNVSLGHNAIVHAATIEDDVIVGIGASVLSGARVGRGSIIAAHAMVPEGKEIPPGSLVIGVPGKVVRDVSPQEVERIKQTAANYRHLGSRYQEMLGGP
jgi:carbonic anhydrase/acetyltransferase-like protein (isoleucine patch superfamily)